MRILVLLFFAFICFGSCSRSQLVQEDSPTILADFRYIPAKEITSFVIEEKINGNYISEDIIGRFYGNHIYLNFPPGTVFTNLQATIKTVRNDSHIQVKDSGKAPGQKGINFTNPPFYTVTSADGKVSYYKVFCKYDSNSLSAINEKILGQLNLNNLDSHIKEMSLLPTRLNWTLENAQAANYILEVMNSYGYITKRQIFSKENQEHENIVCYFNPSDPLQNPVILGAHYDSINHEKKGANAPGSDDNATGVAFLLETARLLANRQTKPVMFVFFDSEEQGLWGSDYFVKQLSETGIYPEFNFTVDMIGGFDSQPDDLASIMEYQRNEPDSLNKASRALGTELLSFLYAFGGLTSRRQFIPCSDFVPFMEKGIPAIGLIEGHFNKNPNYHNDRDTFENMKTDYYYKVCRGALAFILYKTKLKDG